MKYIKLYKIFESNSNEILYKEILNAYEIDNFINNRVDMDQCDIDLIFDYIDTSDLKYLFLTRKVDKHSQDVNKKFIVFFGNGYHFRIYKLPDDYYFMFDLNYFLYHILNI